MDGQWSIKRELDISSIDYTVQHRNRATNEAKERADQAREAVVDNLTSQVQRLEAANTRITAENRQLRAASRVRVASGQTPTFAQQVAARALIDSNLAYIVEGTNMVEYINEEWDEDRMLFHRRGEPDAITDTLTRHASACGHAETLRWLLDHADQPTCDPNTRCENYTPLDEAVMSGNVECVRLLLDAGAEPVVSDDVQELARDDDGWDSDNDPIYALSIVTNHACW